VGPWSFSRNVRRGHSFHRHPLDKKIYPSIFQVTLGFNARHIWEKSYFANDIELFGIQTLAEQRVKNHKLFDPPQVESFGIARNPESGISALV
jgi:hypothetical protein